MPARIAISRITASPFGARLRQWRALRRLSQLELSLRSGVSARHLSRAGNQQLRFFSTMTRLMSAGDVGLEEIGVECLHPADEATRRFCVALADPRAAGGDR